MKLYSLLTIQIIRCGKYEMTFQNLFNESLIF